MNTKTRRLTATALMAALMLIMGLAPLPVGYIPVPIGPFSITLMCLPVIIGTVLLGWQSGLFLGLLFGITSLVRGVSDPLTMALINQYPFAMFPAIFVARLLIPLTTYGMYRLTKRMKRAVGLPITAAVGSVTNTIFFLGIITVLGGPSLTSALGIVLGTTLIVNGLLEMVAAMIVCTPIILALQKVIKKD